MSVVTAKSMGMICLIFILTVKSTFLGSVQLSIFENCNVIN